MTGLDAAFLALETPQPHARDGARGPRPVRGPGGFTVDDGASSLLAERLHPLAAVPAPGRRVPFGLHHPLWIEDPDFDLDYHVRQVAVPGARWAATSWPRSSAEVAGRPLDRSRPLWQMWVVEGLEHGHVALDRQGAPRRRRRRVGRRAASPSLSTSSPTPRPSAGAGQPSRGTPIDVPSDVEMIGASVVSIARQPLLHGRAVVALGKSVAAIRVVHAIRNEDVHDGCAVHRARGSAERS